MTHLIQNLRLVAAVLACVFAAHAQNIPEPNVERATQVSGEGLREWTEFKAERCPACKGIKATECKHCARFPDGTKCLECNTTRKAPCRTCGGLGETSDPLLVGPCPGCFGASIFPCAVCRGMGSFTIQGVKRPQDCMSCRGAGAYKCEVCKGKRLVETAKLKPDVGAASLKDLRGAQKKIDQVLEKIDVFEPQGNLRKDLKAYKKILAPAAKVLPPIKRSQKMLDNMMKRLNQGDYLKETAERKLEAMRWFMAFNKAYIIHQKKVIDLSLDRAEWNEKAIEDNKKKGGV